MSEQTLRQLIELLEEHRDPEQRWFEPHWMEVVYTSTEGVDLYMQTDVARLHEQLANEAVGMEDDFEPNVGELRWEDGGPIEAHFVLVLN